jgi:hypothetical protein
MTWMIKQVRIEGNASLLVLQVVVNHWILPDNNEAWLLIPIHC